MACKNNYCLCNRLVISESVSFADNTLTINIPAGAYENREKYCIIIAQDIPTETTISANVVITIGDDTTTYPLVNPNCTNVSACKLQSRTKYATRVFTNIQSGVFKLIEQISCNNCSCGSGAAPSLPIQTAAAASETGGGT